MKTHKFFLVVALALLVGQVTHSQALSRTTPAQFLVNFDNAPQEITWEIRIFNSQGTTSFRGSGGPYDVSNSGKTVIIPFPLALRLNSTYQVILRDSGGNGFNGGQWAVNARSIRRGAEIGERIFNGPIGFGSETTVTFSPRDRAAVGNFNPTLADISPLTTEGGTPAPGPCSIPKRLDNVSINATTVNYSSGPIDISCVSNPTITMNIQGKGPMENADFLNIFYTVDGGSPIAISRNRNAFASKSISSGVIQGNSIEILIQGKTSFRDETYIASSILVAVPRNSGRKLTPEVAEQNEISVYPNPTIADSTITISGIGSGRPISIYNIAGQQVKQVVSSSLNEKVNLNGIENGIYILTAGSTTTKLIIRN